MNYIKMNFWKIGSFVLQDNSQNLYHHWSNKMFIFVKDAKYLKDYKIEVEFNDGKRGVVDLQDDLYGEVFEPLKDKNLFSKIKVDEDLETIVWENGADLAPEYLYYKSFKDNKNLKPQFKKWGYI